MPTQMVPISAQAHGLVELLLADPADMMWITWCFVIDRSYSPLEEKMYFMML